MSTSPSAEKFMAIAEKSLPLYELPRLKTLIEDYLDEIGFYTTELDSINTNEKKEW